MQLNMSFEQRIISADSVSDTESQINALLQSLSAELEREISIKECRQATSTTSLQIESDKESSL